MTLESPTPGVRTRRGAESGTCASRIFSQFCTRRQPLPTSSARYGQITEEKGDAQAQPGAGAGQPPPDWPCCGLCVLHQEPGYPANHPKSTRFFN
jgi:hypothetical protein